MRIKLRTFSISCVGEMSIMMLLKASCYKELSLLAVTFLINCRTVVSHDKHLQIMLWNQLRATNIGKMDDLQFTKNFMRKGTE